MRLSILSSLISIVIGATTTLAADDPAWEELSSLFGMDIESAKVKQVVDTYSLSKAAKGDSGSFTPKHKAYSLMFRGDRISTIVVQVSAWPEGYGGKHWREFSRALPANIQRDHLRKNILEKFGKSHTKKGDTWIIGELEIWIFFNKKTGMIDEFYVSRHIPPDAQKKPAEQNAVEQPATRLQSKPK